MQVPFRGDAPPSACNMPYYSVIAPQRGETLDLTVLDSEILGVDCHWVIDEQTRQGRSRRCYRDAGRCDLCETHRKLWLGFVSVRDNVRKARCILRLGLESARRLAAFWGPVSGLRGVRVRVRRFTEGDTSQLGFEALDAVPADQLPSACRMEYTLAAVLGGGDIPDARYTGKDIPTQDAVEGTP